MISPCFSYADLYSLYEQREQPQSGWDEALPSELEDFPAATQHLLAKLYRWSRRPLPRWRQRNLPLEVNVEWERTELCRNPELSTSNFSLLVQNLDWQCREIPISLLERMSGSSERIPQLESILGWDTCLRESRCTLEDAHEALLRLLESSFEDVVLQALIELQKPHFTLCEIPSELLHNLVDVTERIAVETIRAWGERTPSNLLRQLIEDHEKKGLQLEALSLFGPKASEGDLPLILDCLSADCEYFGDVGLRVILQMRRNDINLRSITMEQVFELMENGFSSECLVELVSGRWEEWVEKLREIDCDSPLWPTYIETLKSANHRVATDFLLHLLKARALSHSLDLVICALADQGSSDGEEDVIGLVPEYPEACLYFFQRAGGEAIQALLAGQLRLDMPTLCYSKSQILETFLILGGRVCLDDWVYEVSDWTARALRLVGPEKLPPELLGRIVAGQDMDRALEGVRILGKQEEVPILRSLLASEKESIAEEAAGTLRVIGSRWFKRGRRQAARFSGEIGAADAFLAECLMDTISPELDIPILRRLLEKLSRLFHPNLREFFLQWREHSDPEIRKYVLQFEKRHREAPHAHWLLSRLESDDIRDVRWALEALAARGGSWYAPKVAACLSHPNMNIKKTAAQTLARLGNPGVLPQIVEYLSFHDNPGFRADLRSALEKVVGPYADVVMKERPNTLLCAKTEVEESLQSLDVEKFEKLNRAERDSMLRRYAVSIKEWDAEERFDLIEPVRGLLRRESASFALCLELLRLCGAFPTAREAELAWASSKTKLREWALFHKLYEIDLESFLQLVGDCQPAEATGSFVAATFCPVRRALLDFGLKMGWFSHLLEMACESERSWVGELRTSWNRCFYFAPQAEQLLGAWRQSKGLVKSELLNWLGGPRRSKENEQDIRKLLHSPNPAHRQQAAQLLLQWGGERNRNAVVCALLDNRILAVQVPVRLNSVELGRLVSDHRKYRWGVQLRHLILNSTASAVTQVRALLRFRDLETIARPDYQEAFRRFKTETVLQEISSQLADKEWELLPLIPPTGRVPDEITELLQEGDEETKQALFRVLLDWDRVLESERLRHFLFCEVKSGAMPQQALKLLAKFGCWQDNDGSKDFLRFLEPLRESSNVGRLANNLFARTFSRIPVIEQVRWRWDGSADPAFTLEVARRCLERVDLLDSLPQDLKENVLEHLNSLAQERDSEKALGALKALLVHQPEEADVFLRAALTHPRSRIRFFAHRELKKLLPRQSFFAVSLELLRDPQPSMRKRAINILSHGKYLPAIPVVVELLWDKKRKVNRVARDGLLRYGKPALSHLIHREGKERPDRRRVVRALIEELEEQER